MTSNENKGEGEQFSKNVDKPLSEFTKSKSISATLAEEASCHEGYVSPTARHISTLEIASVGWSICNSWVGVVTTLAFNISNGGPPGLLYGLCFVFIMYGFIVYTLAELSRIYPSAGGQYHWTAILAPKWCARVMSYTCGIVNIFAWAALSAGVAVIVPQALLAMVIHYNPSYELQRWHVFLIYQVVSLLCIMHNVFTIRRTMWLFEFMLGLSLVTFVAVTITSLARAPHFQSSKTVWITFVDFSGWNNTGVVFFIGLLTPGYMYAGIDGAIHLAEEATNAREAVPKALLSTWIIGFVTSFIVAVACMYSAQDFDMIAKTPTGFPIFELWRQAMRSEAAATTFIVFAVVAGFMAVAGCQQTASRLTWSFARDSGLIASSRLSRINDRYQVPIWALCANGFVIFIIGCIYLGSSTAFNAFIGTGLILQLITFAFPASLLLVRGRPMRFLPKTRTFGLPTSFGWVANLFTVAFAILCFIFYDFPAIRPVTAANMNYAIVVIGGMGIFGVVNWFVHAKKHYHGPQVEDLLAL